MIVTSLLILSGSLVVVAWEYGGGEVPNPGHSASQVLVDLGGSVGAIDLQTAINEGKIGGGSVSSVSIDYNDCHWSPYIEHRSGDPNFYSNCNTGYIMVGLKAWAGSGTGHDTYYTRVLQARCCKLKIE